MVSTSRFWLFLLLNQLPFRPADADVTTTPLHEDYSSISLLETSFTTINASVNEPNVTRADCLIDTEMGLIAIGSAGALIICLLITTVVLAWQVWHLQHRVQVPRSSRSNLDLVGSAGYWGDDRPEAQGLIGPCDASVMLEEVTSDNKEEEEEEDERQTEIQESEGAGLEEGAMVMTFDATACQMQGSSSRDSCLEVPRDLEDMPLVV